MKKYLYFLLSIVFVVVLVGCSGENEFSQPQLNPNPDPNPIGGASYTQYYITHYKLVDGISYRIRDEQSTTEHSTLSEMPAISLIFDGPEVHGHKNQDQEAFRSFQDMYNDKYFEEQTIPASRGALAYPIDKITLTCHENFDAEHPAGATVDDIVKMQLVTYETYINNGYSYPAEWEHLSKGTVYPIGLIPKGEFFLSEVNSNVSKLIPIKGLYTYLKFMKEPDVPGEYPFTLEITFNGETLETRFELTFGNTVDEE